jgi:DNA-binding transcriptional ArsR family regulator
MSKPRRQRRFIKLYIKPLKEKLSEIDGSALKVYIALALEIDWLKNTVEIYIIDLMKKTGLSEKTVRISLKKLQELGLMEKSGPTIRRQYILKEEYVQKGREKKFSDREITEDDLDNIPV